MTLISEIGNFSYIQLKQYNPNKDTDWHSIINCIKNNIVIDFSIYIYSSINVDIEVFMDMMAK